MPFIKTFNDHELLPGSFPSKTKPMKIKSMKSQVLEGNVMPNYLQRKRRNSLEIRK